MMLRRIVDDLREQIGKSERLAQVAQYPFEELIEAAAPPGHEPRAPRRRAQAAIRGHFGAGAARGQVVPCALARSFTRREVQCRSQPLVKMLGIRAAEQ